MRNHFSLRTVICGILLAAVSSTSSQTQQAMVRLKGNISPPVAKAHAVGRMSAGERIRFSIALPIPNKDELDNLLQRLYTPGDPLYHQYLKKGEFGDRFGAAQADYDAVIEFVRAQGLEVMQTHPNRLLLEVEGTAAQIERAFDVHLMNYQGNNGRVFHAPDSEPALPASVSSKIAGIIDLDDALEPQPDLVKSAAGRPDSIGSGPLGGLTPDDIKAAYNLAGVSETGTGQTIALFELDGYQNDDIAAYEEEFFLPQVPLTPVLVDGYNGGVTNPKREIEVALDIELAIALAPGATKVLVYEGKHFNTIFQRIADDNAAQVVSASWHQGLESDVSLAHRNSEDTAFRQMAAQGQSMYCSSGDYADHVSEEDADGNLNLQFGVADPVSQPYVTGVGGTTLATNDAGQYQSEVVWHHQNSETHVITGSGGGVSTYWPLPFYQSPVVSSGSGGSSSNRNVPDVGLDADPNSGYAIRAGGSWMLEGGTSASTPLWAAFTALVNQRRASNGKGPLGFANPALYKIANSAQYASDFHDITSGNNGTYPAVSGYDNCTGWGTFIGSALLSDLAKEPDVLYVDGNYTGALQDGTVTHPFKTVTAAVNAAVVFHPTLKITGHAYPETLSISKHMVLLNNGGGHVTIGSSTNH